MEFRQRPAADLVCGQIGRREVGVADRLQLHAVFEGREARGFTGSEDMH